MGADRRPSCTSGPASASPPWIAHGRPAPGAVRDARACKRLLTKAGLSGVPGLRPMPLAEYPAVRELERTGRIERAAVVMGLASLDAAAAAIRYLLEDGSQDLAAVQGAGPVTASRVSDQDAAGPDLDLVKEVRDAAIGMSRMSAQNPQT